jgi:dihydrofolate reductase
MISLIVAYAKNHVIGNRGCIPWKIPGEQKRFRELTMGNVVVLGRISYEEIGHPLPNRTTIVVSTSKNYDGEDCITASSLEEAIQIAGERDVYISGGSRLYQESVSLVDKMFITEIDAKVEGDTYFPEFDEADFIKEVVQKVDGAIPYTYLTYTRRR